MTKKKPSGPGRLGKLVARIQPAEAKSGGARAKAGPEFGRRPVKPAEPRSKLSAEQRLLDALLADRSRRR